MVRVTLHHPTQVSAAGSCPPANLPVIRYIKAAVVGGVGARS